MTINYCIAGGAAKIKRFPQKLRMRWIQPFDKLRASQALRPRAQGRVAHLRRILKTFLTLLLIISWTLTGLPQIPFINFPPKIQEAQAAFPTIFSTATSQQTTGSTTSNVTLPASVAAGDLIIAIIGADSGALTATWPSPWVEIRDTSGTGFVFYAGYLIASGGETTVAVTHTLERSNHIAMRIRAAEWHGTTPPEITTIATGSSLNPNPPSLTPSWGALDTLWVAIAVADDSTVPFPITAYPTNYSNNQISHAVATSAASIGMASRGVNAASEDPGTFTMTVTETWGGLTLAVRPTAVVVPGAPTLWPDDGGSNQIAFNNTRQNDTTPIIRASATHTSTFNRFQVEFNTASDFGGTAYTEPFNGTYSSGTQYNLQTTGTLGLPTTNGVTYYVRARASADGGANYGSWSSGTRTYTYTSTAGDAEWFQTTDEQFDTGTLTSTQTDAPNDRVKLSADTIFFDDYETGNHNNWTGTTTSGTGLAQVLSTNPYAGTWAGRYYRSTASDLADVGFAYKDFTAPAGNVVWAKGYFRFDSIPGSTYSTTNNVLSLSTTNLDQTKARFNAYNSNVLRCNYLNKDGTWYGSNWGTSLTTGSYYALKIKFDRSGANPVITWYVNNTQICTTTDTTAGTAYTPTRVKAGTILDTGITYPDNWYTGTADTRADNVGVYSSNPDVPTGTIISPEIDFDWVPGRSSWGTAAFSTTETNGDVKLRVYYTVSTACDTIVPDGVLSGNSSGFDVSASPIDISGLVPVASTYNKICLQATLTNVSGTPFLNDWTVTWEPAAEAIAVDAVSTGQSTGGTSITISHATGGGANRLMLVGVSIVGAETVSTVTYGGVALTSAGFVANSDDSTVEIWKLVAPVTGTANVVVTFSAALAQSAVAGVITFTGVDQSTPLGTFASAIGDNSSPATVNVSSATGELVFGVVCAEYEVVTTDPSQTQHWNISISGSGSTNAAGSTEAGAAPTVTTSWTLDPAYNHWAVGGISIKPAAGGAAVLTQNDFEFWVDNDILTPVAIWGNPDIAENTALNAVPPSNDPVDPADEIRIRMNISVTGATLAASTEDFLLQYKEAPDCTDAAAWTDVDAAAGGGTWRFAASAVTDNTTLTTLLVSTSDVAGRYSKSDPTTTNPNAVPAGQEFEWDWHVEYNGTAAAKTYCFRMVKSPVAALDAYNADSYPRIDTRPGTADLMRHGNFFTTGVERGFFWAD